MKKGKTYRCLWAWAGLLGVMVVVPAWGETEARIDVRARIVRGCALQSSAEKLDFGTHPSVAQGRKRAQVLNTVNSWRIECTPNIPVAIQFDRGRHYDQKSGGRRMSLSDGTAYLPYRLFYDPNHTQEIKVDRPRTYRSTTSNKLLNLSVYGVTDLSVGALNKVPGTYMDRLLITVEW